MKKLILFISFLYLKSFAQPAGMNASTIGSVNNIQFYNLSPNGYEDVLSGSPYLSSDFQAGSVILSSNIGKWQTGYQFRLNTYTKQLEFKENGIIKTASPKQVRAFKIGDTIFMSGFKPIENNTVDTYYQVVYEGKVKLLKNTITLLEEVKAADDVKQGSKFSTYDFYYLIENENFTKFFPNKKNFLKVISPEKSAKVESYITNKKLKMKDTPDFLEAIKYYDSL